jgi:2-hydroxychromene-2-carboxylate isomerase
MIEFWFDFSSPYGYLASHQIDALATRHGRDVEWRPFLLGAVMKLTGAVPLVNVALKGDYSRRDFERSARFHDVPFKMPEKFPTASRHTAAGFYAIEDRERAKAYARAVYHNYFVEGRTPDTRDAAADAATAIRLDRDAFLARLAEGNARLDAVTEEAKARGIFGSPFFVVEGELFWGVDRLPMLERWIDRGRF